jgi:hypothetical protein
MARLHIWRSLTDDAVCVIDNAPYGIWGRVYPIISFARDKAQNESVNSVASR